MFNGIIYNTGKVKVIEKSKNSLYVGITTNLKLSPKDLGASICFDGVCLTVDRIDKNLIYFYISGETLKRSNLKSLRIKQIINFILLIGLFIFFYNKIITINLIMLKIFK